MNPERRPGAIDVSSSVVMKPGFTGLSSMSWGASVAELSKSGSSSSGGTSTTVFRFPGPPDPPGPDAGFDADGRFGTTGFTRGGSAAGLPAGGRPRGFNFGGGGGGGAGFFFSGAGATSMLPSNTKSASSRPGKTSSPAGSSVTVGSSSAIGSSSRSAGFSSSRMDGVLGVLERV